MAGWPHLILIQASSTPILFPALHFAWEGQEEQSHWRVGVFGWIYFFLIYASKPQMLEKKALA